MGCCSPAHVGRVGILGWDQHYGDGTNDIGAHLSLRDSLRHASAEHGDLGNWGSLRFSDRRGIPA